MTTIQQWECIITNIKNKTIEIEMHDLTNESNPTEIAEIKIKNFPKHDHHLLTEGTVFYWNITTTNQAKHSNFKIRKPHTQTKNK